MATLLIILKVRYSTSDLNANKQSMARAKSPLSRWIDGKLMAEKPGQATRRSWMQIVGVPRLTLAVILIITAIGSTYWFKPSIEAGETDQPKVDVEVRVSSSSSGPRSSNRVADLLDI